MWAVICGRFYQRLDAGLPYGAKHPTWRANWLFTTSPHDWPRLDLTHSYQFLLSVGPDFTVYSYTDVFVAVHRNINTNHHMLFFCFVFSPSPFWMGEISFSCRALCRALIYSAPLFPNTNTFTTYDLSQSTGNRGSTASVNWKTVKNP